MRLDVTLVTVDDPVVPLFVPAEIVASRIFTALDEGPKDQKIVVIFDSRLSGRSSGTLPEGSTASKAGICPMNKGAGRLVADRENPQTNFRR